MITRFRYFRATIVAKCFARFTMAFLCGYAACIHTAGGDFGSICFVQFQKATFFAAENETNALITVTRSGDFRQWASVDFQVSDGTATAGEDYKPAGGELVFVPYETTKSFLVPIISDKLVETTETVRLTLLNPAENTVIIRCEAALVIMDAPPPVEPPPLLAVGACQDGVIALSWPGDRLDCFLEQTDNPGNSWTMLPATPYEMEGRLIVEQPASNNSYFYRLRSR